MKWRIILPSVYIAMAAFVWIDFATTNPDGLANAGLMLAVLPVTVLGLLLGWLLGASEFVLLPSRFGYIADHALFYIPSVLLVAAALWVAGRRLDHRR